MRYEKKQIAKEDGRYLVFYHFPDTATAEQTSAFQAAAGETPVDSGQSGPAAAQGDEPAKPTEDAPRV